jgi:hypothetical protein
MSQTLKTILIILGSLCFLGILAIGTLFAFVVVGDNKAKAKATALCQSAVVGSSSDRVLDRAVKSGSGTRDPQWHTTDDGTAELLVVFPAALPLTGYMCSISAKDGVVTAAAITTVD